MKNSKVLVIHPDDRSTDFLKAIYKDIECTIINQSYPPILYHDLLEAVKTHDQIIMLGHGTPAGLLLCGKAFGEIEFINVLRSKKDNIYIWCNADQYVIKHDLKGFYSGMFISEVGEAMYFGIRVPQVSIDYSNNLFAHNLGKLLAENKTSNILNEIRTIYYDESCPVIQFNNRRLYKSETIKPATWFEKFINYWK